MKKINIIALLLVVIVIAVIIKYFNDPIIPNPSSPTYQDIYNTRVRGGEEKAKPLKELVLKSFKSKVHYLRSYIDYKSEYDKFMWVCDSNYLSFFPITNDILKEILPDLVTKYKNLTELHLLNNKLTYIPLGLGQIKTLKILNLPSNKINSFSNIGNFGQLEELDLTDNQIQDLNNLNHLINLKNLNLANNQIWDIINLSHLKNLEYLNLADNQIYEIDNLIHLKKLKYLDISGNRIKKLKNLSKLKQLEYLGISYNPIADYTIVSNLPNLKSLRIEVGSSRGNSIKVRPDLPDIKYMTEEMRLSNIDTIFVNQPQLNRNFSLRKLPKLKRIYLCDYVNDIKYWIDIADLEKRDNLNWEYLKDFLKDDYPMLE